MPVPGWEEERERLLQTIKAARGLLESFVPLTDPNSPVRKWLAAAPLPQEEKP